MQTETDTRNTREGGKRKPARTVITVLFFAVLCCIAAQFIKDVGNENANQAGTFIGEGGIAKENVGKSGSTTLTEKQKLEYICSSGKYPDILVQMAENNAETIDFVYGYTEFSGRSFDIDLKQEAKSGEVPLLLQWDKRWGYETYGEGIIATSGCGPVSLSMAAVYLTGDDTLDPKYIAQFASENGYCIPGNGSSWTLISEGSASFGLCAKELPLDEQVMKSALDEGKPIIVVVGPGDFTSSGHYMVITGYDNKGFVINDPNCLSNSDKRWSYDTLYGQIRNLWAMSKI